MITKNRFIRINTKASITSKYRFLTMLGKGGFGEIYRVQDVETGNIYACKQINKASINNAEQFQTELGLLKETDHPNVVRLYEVIESIDFIYLIMEECLGGELFTRIAHKTKKGERFTEESSRIIFKQIIQSINYLHTHGVCHRDIKPENIMFTSIEDNSPIKLIDFGLSKIFAIDQWKTANIVGTPLYMAPEVFIGKYNEKCDVWSCGVILYILLSGRAPFFSKDRNNLIELIIKGQYSFNFPEFSTVSNEAKDLITKMLCEQNRRISAKEVLEQEWLFKKDNNSTPNSNTLKLTYDKMVKYADLNIFQKSVIFYTTFNLSNEDTSLLATIFKSLDINNDGVLTFEEMKNAIHNNLILRNKINIKQLNFVFSCIDVDNNSLLNYTEFIAAIYEYNKKMGKKQLLQCFRNFDMDHSGQISFDNLLQIIIPQTEEQKKYLYKLYQTLDKNGDNGIDFEEFVNAMNLDANLNSKQMKTRKTMVDAFN